MKHFVFYLVVITAAVMLAACGSGDQGASGDQAKTYEWKLGYSGGKDSVRGKAAKEFKKVLEEKTDGRISVKLYPDSKLGTVEEMIEQVKIGSLDLQVSGANMLAKTVPEYAALSLPFLLNDFDEAHAALDSELVDGWEEKIEESGVHVLSNIDLGFAQITNNKTPINTPEDIKGLKMRAPNDNILIETYKNFGASVSTMPYSEVYLALSQGVVDGQFNPLEGINERKFYEVQDYLAYVNQTFYFAPLIMNNGLYKGLDDESKKAVQEAAQAAQQKTREYSVEIDKKLQKELQDDFKKITKPDVTPFKEAVKPVYEKMRDSLGEGTLEDVQSFLEQYRAKQ